MSIDPLVPLSLPAIIPLPVVLTGTALVPIRRGFLSVEATCGIVNRMAGEMSALVSERTLHRRDRRRTMWHIRQISMYVCHVALQIPIADIADAFGRDRTTVAYSLRIVEGRRDDLAYDGFVDSVERLAGSVFAASQGAADEH
ncbi:helix-turn-helix domain-containing protein [Rhizobium tumorigenes]|uniref:helix-turn-helix domain-containing protein n=1 Tax=Rhizobium tumorigenes TaxID=2041385 RepID=UPI00241EFC4C|nr:helix-turn-helix domain-containing protein [Rhizobium tumorigenes]WFS01716.1 helix-turn-helix domain-containing protein [Rhizobium tumorigenes]